MGTAQITEWELGRNVATSGGVALTVDFDPKSLALSYSPTGPTPGSSTTPSGTWSEGPAQQTGLSTSLTVDLTFDTSTTGDSVQGKTDQLVRLTRPVAQPSSLSAGAPARKVVRFSWGTFLFYGTVSSMSQTIDFFSEDGVPLRAAVHLSLSEVSPRDPNSGSVAGGAGSALGGGASAGFGASASLGASASFGASAGLTAGAALSANASASASVGTTPVTLAQSGDTLQAIAARAGGQGSWKAVASANGIDNPRLVPPGTVIDASAQASAG